MKIFSLLTILSLTLIFSCAYSAENHGSSIRAWKAGLENPELKKATLAGGCFWCMEPPFERLEGVVAVVAGYSGGHAEKPSYDQVSSGSTGHAEAVQVLYDPSKISFEDILEVFWRNIDPTDRGGQFADRGSQYRTAVFYHDEEQRRAAEVSKSYLEDSKKFERPIVTSIEPFMNFYPAEEYHQDYFKKQAAHYKRYKKMSGREGYLEQTWGRGIGAAVPIKDKLESFEKPSDDKLKQILSPLQFQVTQKDGTERAFANEYWNNKKEGIYVDVVSGEPLFSSRDKYESGTGWPSFTKPLEPSFIVEKIDRSLGMARTEVRSKYGDSHIGHVFPDGPQPTGLRYCLNSAALRFIPKEDLEKEGYGEYLSLFER